MRKHGVIEGVAGPPPVQVAGNAALLTEGTTRLLLLGAPHPSAGISGR
ncbi:MAG: hypothetical protein AAFY65_20455 [Pseudomonadota bacterium]